MRISDWSSDVCSSDLATGRQLLGLRPEQIEIGRGPVAAGPNVASGVVTDTDYIGDITTITVRLPDGQIARAAQLNAIREPLVERDSTVWLSWDAEALISLADSA